MSDELQNRRHSAAFAHWAGAMRRTFSMVPSLVFEATYRGQVLLLGMYCSDAVDRPVNDNVLVIR